jgi:hypothetical protein
MSCDGWILHTINYSYIISLIKVTGGPSKQKKSRLNPKDENKKKKENKMSLEQ